jgi:hypothetical protein
VPRSLLLLLTVAPTAIYGQAAGESHAIEDGAAAVAQTPPAAQAAPPRPNSGSYETRAQQIESARKAKAAVLQPETVSGAEHAFLEVRRRRLIEKFQYGWHGLRPRIGGLVTGGGFAFGPEYRNDEIANGELIFRTSARATLRRFQHYDMELAAPAFAGGHLFADLLAVHRNYPEMQYYGPGPNSQRSGRSNYRLEDTLYQGEFGVRPVRPLRLGVSAGFLEVNVGPGTRKEWVSTERIYSPPQTPGIDRQTDFARGSAFAEIDYRDIPGGPRSGGLYRAQLTYNKDVDLERHTFRRLDAEAQQYIGLFNQRRVIALRGKTSLTYANPGRVVPFYMQPTLGGSDDLRGFRPFRFYGDNMVVYNAEYRFEVFSGLDMAVFADAGKVFQRRAELNFKDLETSWGGGFRFNARNNVFLRIDVGISHEGFQVWFKFGNVF